MRWILALVVLAALGAGAWLVLGNERGGEDALEEGAGRREGEAEQGPQLAGGGRGSGRTAVATKGRCTIECRVLRDGKSAAAVVEARRVGGADAADFSRAGPAPWVKSMFAPPAPAGPATASASSDAAGKATLAGLAPGAYRLTARGPDGTLAKTNVVLAADGARVGALLELVLANLSLDAKVTWSDGRPASGTLLLTPRESPSSFGYFGAAYAITTEDSPRATIAADGSARVEGLSTGSYDVRALLGEVVVTGPRATLPATGTYVLTIAAPGQQVSGRVLDAAGDAPIAGANVTVQASMDERSSMYFARAVAGPDGRFTLSAPKSGGAGVTVEATGYALAWRTLGPSDTEFVVRLVRAARVSGRVATADGQPAAGAVVVASPEGNTRGLPTGTRTTATADRDGRYALEGLVPGDMQIVVKGGGWVSPGLADAQPSGFNPFVKRVPAAGAITLDLSAVPAAKIQGRALDLNGAPVAGASVVARPGGRSQFFGRLDPTNPDTASSDTEGRFTLDSLTPDSAYTLTADAPEQPQAKAGPFAVPSGTTAQVEIRFTAPRYVDVLVLYEGEDTPVAGARVSLLVNNSSQAALVRTDADGRARVGPAGEGSLSLQISGATVALRAQATPVDGADDGPGPYPVTMRVTRGFTVEGRVLKADGTPAGGATVETDGRWRGPMAGDSATASDGTFRLSGMPAGPQAIRATWRGPGGARLTGRATATGGAKDVTITLGADDAKPMETFKIHVLDDAGAPVPSAQASIAFEGGNMGVAVSDGWATLQSSVGPESSLGKSLAKGTAFVDVSDARSADGLPLAVGPARVGPLAADQRDVEVRLPGEKTIEGRVVAGDGARLAGVLVTARAQQKNQTSQARTDASGRFRIGGLGEGDYLVSVAAAPEFVSVPTATVAAGTKDHLVRLKLGVTARIRVLDYGGKAVSGASVVAEPTPATPAPGAMPGRGVPTAPPAPGMGGGEDWYPDGRGGFMQGRGGGVTTTDDGIALLRGLDGDLTFTLRVQVPAGRDDVRPYRQEKWNPGDTDVRLERGHLVAGTVRDAAGALVEGARVERKTGEGRWSGVNMTREGTFRITGLDPGPVVLRATGPGGRRGGAEGAAEITVQAGNERVVLVVDPGLKLTARITNLADRKEGGRPFLSAILLRWQDDKWTHGEHGWDREGTGTVVFLGLKPDTRYALWIPPNPGDDLYGWATDVRPGDVNVRLERGGTIRGRITGPPGVTLGGNISANNDNGMGASGMVDAEGRFEIKGLPDGRWNLHAWHQTDGKQYRASGEAQTGGTVDLTLQVQADGPPMPAPAPAPVLR